MKLVEIQTKDEFKRKLQDPPGEEITKEFQKMAFALRGQGWVAHLKYIKPGEMYLSMNRAKGMVPPADAVRYLRNYFTQTDIAERHNVELLRGEAFDYKGIDMDWSVTYETENA